MPKGYGQSLPKGCPAIRGAGTERSTSRLEESTDRHLETKKRHYEHYGKNDPGANQAEFGLPGNTKKMKVEVSPAGHGAVRD
jgi:hypothetical protein